MFLKTLGFFIFLIIFVMGFGMLTFLASFVGYWLTLLGIEKVNPKLAHKMIKYKEGDVLLVGLGAVVTIVFLVFFSVLVF